jgi:hypothetical protein
MNSKVKKYISPSSNQTATELIQTWEETSWSEMNKLVNSVWNKEELPDHSKELIIVPIYSKGDRAGCSN